MSKGIEKGAGVALLIGSLLMLSTMILHPRGGSMKHLQNIAISIVVSHSLALLAIPFLAVGFYGLLKKLGDHFLPILSFAIMLTGLIAGMMAATINGLALPLFIENYYDVSVDVATTVKPIMKNNIALNQAFDYVFLCAVSLSILLWSISILTLKKLPHWIGYFGLLLSFTALAMLVSGYLVINLHGFRLFIFSTVVWFIAISFALFHSKPVLQHGIAE